MFYRISADKGTTGQLTVSDKFFRGNPIARRNTVEISLGNRNEKVNVVKTNGVKENNVKLSEDVLKSLMLPEGMEYQIIVEKDGLRVGPVIGLLMSNNMSHIGRGSLAKIMNYTLIYPEIKGLIVVFSSDSVDFENKSIQGYYYNPETKGRKLPWKQGVFPMPDSIFSRTYISEDISDKLRSETGNHFFNSTYFNKWEFWRKVSKDRGNRQHLPYTRYYSSLEDIDYILDEYGAAYLKPLNGTLSRGLFKVTKSREVYEIQGKKGSDVEKFTSREEAQQYMKEIMKGHKYIVQQSISPLRLGRRHIDFRVIMQKDQTLDWQCTGIIALIGGRGDICTNWGSTSTFENIFYDIFNYSQQQIFKKKSEVVAACKGICESLDTAGENYGDLGFDVVIDEDLKVWVLEANKRHYHSVPLWINDVQTFYQTKSNPIKYAAAQAGFQVY